MQATLPFASEDKLSNLKPVQDRVGVVYTKPWIVDLILDLAGYTSNLDLVKLFAVEPAAGEGAFLISMALRLITSCQQQGYPIQDCKNSLLAFELDGETAKVARTKLIQTLINVGISQNEATELTTSWIKVGDYLLEAGRLPEANFVIGNPPYIRLEDVPEEDTALYRASYATMIGRADIYVAFYEAALTQLSEGGVCAFICADRWMFNRYGSALRAFITSKFGVESVIEMHNAAAFLSEVDAYPAITVIRKASQSLAVVASIDQSAEETNGELAVALKSIAAGDKTKLPQGVLGDQIFPWFQGQESWICTSLSRLSILKDIEGRFPLLECEETETKIGIGVATGADKIFITKDASLVESSRLLPLALVSDIKSGRLQWSGHYLVNPWDEEGIVDLEKYPLLKAYYQKHKTTLLNRHIAKKNPAVWPRTIDRVSLPLQAKPKLYIADIKNRLNPVLDKGTTYPHHNLYFIQSDKWNLEALGGLLLSDIGQFFVECYGIRMRGGYFRFQAQYLRKIRVPHPEHLTVKQKENLVNAFRDRNIRKATMAALEIYGLESLPAKDR